MDNTAILEKVKNSTFYKAILKEEADALLANRQEAARKIQALEAERAARIKELQADLENKTAEYNKVQESCNVLVDEIKKLKLEIWGADHSLGSQIDKQKDYLRKTASPTIDEAITWFRDRWDELRRKGTTTRGFEGKINPVSLTKETPVITNRLTVNTALKYCQSAINLLQDKIKLVPSLDKKIIDELKSGLPDPQSPEAFIESSTVTQKGKEPGFSTMFRYGCDALDRKLKDLNRRVDAHIFDAAWMKRRIARGA